jgi:hypothetical protein
LRLGFYIYRIAAGAGHTFLHMSVKPSFVIASAQPLEHVRAETDVRDRKAKTKGAAMSGARYLCGVFRATNQAAIWGSRKGSAGTHGR